MLLHDIGRVLNGVGCLLLESGLFKGYASFADAIPLSG